jgi:hypothetical protein
MTRDPRDRRCRHRDRDRRRARLAAGVWRSQQPSETLRSFAAAYRCPDCMSTVDEPARADDTSRVRMLTVRHHDTCPTYRRLQADGLAS